MEVEIRESKWELIEWKNYMKVKEGAGGWSVHFLISSYSEGKQEREEGKPS